MFFIWVFCLALFAGACFYTWSYWKSFRKREQFNDGFIRGHKDTKTWSGSRLVYVYLLLALILLGVALWILFAGFIEPPVAYALVVGGLSLLLVDLAMKSYHEDQLIFYSQGFVWNEMIFPYQSLHVDNGRICQESPIPLSAAANAKAIDEYEKWLKH